MCFTKTSKNLINNNNFLLISNLDNTFLIHILMIYLMTQKTFSISVCFSCALLRLSRHFHVRLVLLIMLFGSRLSTFWRIPLQIAIFVQQFDRRRRRNRRKRRREQNERARIKLKTLLGVYSYVMCKYTKKTYVIAGNTDKFKIRNMDWNGIL